MAKQSRKFQITINNSSTKGYSHEKIKESLMSLKALVYFCMCDEIGKNGTYHTHVYVIFQNPKAFSTIKNLFPEAHLESTIRGSNAQNIDYIKKEGRYKNTDKAETSVPGTFEEWGELPPESFSPTKESEIFDIIEQKIADGLTPKDILSEGVFMYKYEKIIKRAYFDKRFAETPPIRNVTVYFHVGPAGSGKSYTYVKLCEEYGEENVYLMTDYANGGTAGLDGYNGEPVLFMDEYKSNLPYSLFLQLLDRYKIDIHCRYSNATALWNEVHITSIYPPDELYKGMVTEENRSRDNIQQFLRRISFIVYHEKYNDEYRSFQMPMRDYQVYPQLKEEASKHFFADSFGVSADSITVTSQEND